MKKHLFLFFISFLFLTNTAVGERTVKKVTPPGKIEYNDKILTYNPVWKDQETYLEADLDNDADKEVIISFVASYKPLSGVVSDRGPETFSAPKKEIPLIENYSFYQIYDLGPDGHYQLVKTITGMDQLGKVEIITLDKNKPKAVVFLSPGGEHYIDLSVYQWKEGGYRLIFNRGSNQEIEFDPNQSPVTLRIGEETFGWDSEINTFKRRDKNLK
jgi:hypothetical protein